jgi:hypothetical protein
LFTIVNYDCKTFIGPAIVLVLTKRCTNYLLHKVCCILSLLSSVYCQILLKCLYSFIQKLLQLVVGGIRTDNRAFLIIKCLFASFHSLSFMQNDQFLRHFKQNFLSQNNTFKAQNFNFILYHLVEYQNFMLISISQLI